MIHGTAAKVSVLLIVVGLPYRPKTGRERRLEARLALLAFERFEQRGFFAADVGAPAMVRVQVEIEALAEDVLAEKPAARASASASSKRSYSFENTSPWM
jgi:hypothetical protein